MSRRTVRSGLVWGLVFGLAVASSVEQFTNAYDTTESRRQIAGTIGENGALRAIFGSGRALETVPGWTAWRSLGIVTLLGSVWALLAASRWTRGEEDSGRWDLLVTGRTTRRRTTAGAVAALGLGLVALWTSTAAIVLVIGRVPEADFGLGESAHLALAFAAAGQVAATRDEESQGNAGTLLVRPVGRLAWLPSRLLVSAVAIVGLALITGAAGWAGTASQHAGVSLGRMMAAGLNTAPAAIAVLGVGTLAHGLTPRRAATIAYGLVAWSFALQLLGTVGTDGRLLLDLSLFHHVAPVPATPFQATGAAALLGLASAGSLAGLLAFRHRDLAEA